MRVILNLQDGSDNGVLALRAAQWLAEHADRADAVLAYGDSNNPPTMFVKRGKASIIVWEQPR